MQKGDEVDVVVVVEIKLVWQNNFQINFKSYSHEITTTGDYKQIHYVHILLTTQ